MAVGVVGIRHMRMAVLDGLVLVCMAVRTIGHGVVGMVVVAVVMAVRMLVQQGSVQMCMAMRFGQVQHHASQHQSAAQGHQRAGWPATQADGHRSTDEGRKRKHRPSARRAKRPLRQQVKAQAQTVA